MSINSVDICNQELGASQASWKNVWSRSVQPSRSFRLNEGAAPKSPVATWSDDSDKVVPHTIS